MAEPLRVGLAGLGTVGSAVASMLARSRAALAERAGRPIELVAYVSKDPPKDRTLDLSKLHKFDDPVALARAPGIDVFVELMGGEGDPAKSSVEAALSIGRSVVTANKALLARHGSALVRLAESKNAALNFEAAVAGGIPIVKTLREGLGGSRVSRIYGILNGTCNYILTRMYQERLSFAACLKEAQKLGYAEADPTFDIGGFDTAHKLAILTSLAFGTEIDAEAVHVEGIESISLADLEAAEELGYRVKLLGVAQRTSAGIEQRVHPTMVRQGTVVAGVDGVTNAIAIDADTMELTLMGPGAGGAGRALAEWVAGGEPPMDLWPVDIRRFGALHRDRGWVLTRTVEAYSKHYTMAWPHEEYTSGRPLRLSPLYERLKRQGACFGSKLGWERPNWFAPPGVGTSDCPSFEKPNWFPHVAAEHRDQARIGSGHRRPD